MPAKKNAHGGQGRGRGESPQERRREHERTNHAAASVHLTPSFDAAQDYRRARLDLIPLKPRDKVPADPRWQAREYDHAQTVERARRGGLNLGVRLPADVVVVDVDPRNFGGGDSLAKLVQDTGLDLAAAPHVVTGNLDHRGHHYYFRKPAGAVLLDSMEGYPGVEFKSLGRQVVAAGSIHPTGGRYEWAPDSPPLHDMPDLPPRLLDAARRPAPRKGHGAGAGELTPDQLAKTLEQLDPCDFGKGEHERWKELMMACHFATDGEGRQEFIDWCMGDPTYHGQEWIVGRRWDSLHADRDDAVTIATLHMFLNEVGGGIAPPDPEEDFDVWEGDGEPAQPAQRWRFLSIDELEALPPPRWLVPGILVEGSLAAIYGAPESGKSFLAVDMSMAVAGGVDWHGRPVERGAVLYVAAEGAPGLGKRVRAWRLEHGAQGHAFDFRLMRDELNLAAERDGGVRAFAQAVTDELGPLKLVVIDTLNQTAAGADENSAKDMGRYIASMKRLRDETGAAVVVVHHSGKDVSKGMRGSTAILGAMDTTVEVERDGDGRAITVAVRKQKDTEREPPMRFNLEKVADSLVLRPTVMADAAGEFDGGADTTVEVARRMAAERGGRIALKELVEFICSRDACSDKTARRRIEDAIPKGRGSAATAVGGSLVWLEPVNSSNPKLGIVVRTEG
ncbi:TPA: AAA family ATPase [Burkholderia multivorans]|uniref:AAA family ATPase n=1 Tax=Burkholderia multivorans TaxID=87883 RepID=UPI00159124B5|nr:AAA family ATPase [Burkholderia multivorans]MBU9238742.1 AAA family ATPase [Burkholderia multivorans]HEF4747423.1 AAA family ATPase [Burkholderia multivorans]